MSINVGYLNQKYPNIQNNNKDTLSLNSFNNSNVISLNTETTSSEDTFINFKNHIATGIKADSYVLYDISNNSNLFSIDENEAIFNKTIKLNRDLSVTDIINTSNGIINMNSNIRINLNNSNGSFIISSDNQTSSVKIATNDFLISDIAHNNRLVINSNQIDIEKDVFINNGSLYVNSITGLGEGLTINNAVWDSTYIDSINASKQISIVNTNSEDVPSLFINKNYAAGNIISINSTSIQGITNNITLDNDGLFGIGTDNPDATLSIRKISPNIISYDGNTIGAKFRVKEDGDVGIGTTQPSAQLHIRRNDEYNVHNFRREPMLKCDLQYEPVNNISNFDTDYQTYLTNNNGETHIKMISSTVVLNGTTYNNFYLVNNRLAIDIANNDVILSTIDVQDSQIFDLGSDENVVNKVYNLSRLTVSLEYAGTYVENTGTFNTVTYELLMMSKNTKDISGYVNQLGDGYNASNFVGGIPGTEPILVFDELIGDMNYKIKIIVERNTMVDIAGINTYKVEYYYPYTIITNVTVPEPLLMYLSSNNHFVSSISASGTLSLGNQVPDSKKHLDLYSSGTSEFNKLWANNISSHNNNTNTSISFANNGDIYFGHANLSNINEITCSKINIAQLQIEDWSDVGIGIEDLNEIEATTATFKKLRSSNFTFDSLQNNYLSMSNHGVHIKPKLMLGDAEFDENKNAALEIKVTSDIIQDKTVIDTIEFNPRNDGIIITNYDSNANPSLSVKSDFDSKPYIHMSNGYDGYNFRLNRVGNTSYFQLTNDEISQNKKDYFTNDDSTPAILQHTKDDNVLSFGEQNIICIDCENKQSANGINQAFLYNNYSSKVSIGIPYAKLQSTEIATNEKDYIKQYFKTNIVENSEYLLNIYGNVRIADIDDNTMLAVKKNPEKDGVTIAINGEVNSNYCLSVHGDMLSSNITVSGDFNIINNNGDAVNLTSIINGTSRIKFGDTVWSSNIEYVNYSNVRITGDEINIYHPRNIENSYYLNYDFKPGELNIDSSINERHLLLINGESSISNNRESILFASGGSAIIPEEYWNVIDKFRVSFWFKINTVGNYDLIYFYSEEEDDSTNPPTITVLSSFSIKVEGNYVKFLFNDELVNADVNQTYVYNLSQWNNVSLYIDFQERIFTALVNDKEIQYDISSFIIEPGIKTIQIIDDDVYGTSYAKDKGNNKIFEILDGVISKESDSNFWKSSGGFNINPGESNEGIFVASNNSFMTSQDSITWQYNTTGFQNNYEFRYDGEYLHFEMIDDVILSSFTISFAATEIGNAPHGLRLFGSKNNIEWENIYSSDPDVVTYSGSDIKEANINIVQNGYNASYKYYVLMIGKVGTLGAAENGEYYVRIDEIKFKGYSKYQNIVGSELNSEQLYISDFSITYGQEPAQDIPKITTLVDNYYVNKSIHNTSNYILNYKLEIEALVNSIAPNSLNEISERIDNLSLDNINNGTTNKFIVNDTYTGGLTVDGDLTVSGTTSTVNTSVYTTESLEVVSSSLTEPALKINERGTQNIVELDKDSVRKVTIDNDGNVGIGTSEPTEMLEVAGNLKVSGDIMITTGSISMASYEKILIGTFTRDASYEIFDGSTAPQSGIYIVKVYVDTWDTGGGDNHYRYTYSSVPFYWFGNGETNGTTSFKLPRLFGSGHTSGSNTAPEIEYKERNSHPSTMIMYIVPQQHWDDLDNSYGKTVKINLFKIA